MLEDVVIRYDHPVWVTLEKTLGSYGIIPLVMIVFLFLIPFLIFLWF